MARNGLPTAAPVDAENPRAAMLDTYPAEEVVKLLLDEEGAGLKAAKAAAGVLAEASRLLADRMAAGARLIFVGVGTAGRIGALEAAECVPLYGLPPSLVVPVLAGGPHALARTVELSQDNRREAEQRMRKAAAGPADVVCALADGEPSLFLLAALDYARFRRAKVILLTCVDPGVAEDGSALADLIVRLEPGPEIITGVSRAKAATTLKVALSALVNATFVQLGKTYGGLMVDVRPTTARTWQRAIGVVARLCRLEAADAEKLIKKAGGRAKVALVMHHTKVNAARAKELLVQHRGSLRAIVGDIDLEG
jgi:N-acetylmuramic acid 6-phosphate etherase